MKRRTAIYIHKQKFNKFWNRFIADFHFGIVYDQNGIPLIPKYSAEEFAKTTNAIQSAQWEEWITSRPAVEIGKIITITIKRENHGGDKS